MYRYLLSLCLGLLPACFFAQDFMMQGWYWDYPKPGCNGYSGQSLAAEMAAKAAAQKNAGFTMMWLPPMTKASFGNCSNGYDPKDIYDYGQYSGATGLGPIADVNSWRSALAANNILPVADVVYNHRDGGDWEDNPAVRNYIGIPPSGPWPGCGTATPYPVNGKLRYRLPLGGSSGNGAGNYYFKFRSASGNGGFNGRPYKLYFRTQNTAYINNPINELEPNGGGDCGQVNNQIFLGRDIFATEEIGGCNTDEFYLQLNSGDFNAAGDHLEIYIEEVGGGGSGIDIRPYGIWSSARGMDILGDLAVQTRTNFAGLPSGKGAMNYLNFKPNGAQQTCMTGDEEYPYFFFDVEQAHSSTGLAYRDWNKFLWDTVGIRGYRMDAVKHFPAWFVGALLNEMHAAGMNPPMVVGEHFTSFAPALKSWIDGVYSSMNMNARNAISVRAFDFELRQALKDACDNGLFDVRNIFQSGLVGNPATLMSGNNAVTFINNHDYRTSGEHILNRMMLAYAYILTNNKIGLPCVFYPDYYGVNIYGPSNPIPAMQTQIDQLMQVHKNYIAGATFVDYLNRFGTPYSSAYLQSGPYDLLLYQIQYGPVPNKDVIVAINFENQPLRVNHTINTFRAPVGTQFNLIAGSANTPAPIVEANSPNNIPNSIYLDIPAYSYAVFVQGAILPVTLTSFEATSQQKSVQLSWAAATEDQFAGYEVQRSLDGQTYQKIAWVDPKGTAGGPARYELYDNEPVFNQPMYYRLRMVDLDGSAEFSPVRSVTLQQKQAVMVFPNPSEGQFFIRFEELVEAGTQLEIFDAMGRRISQKMLEEGALLEEINLDGAAKGVYRLRITRAGQVIYNGVLHHIR